MNPTKVKKRNVINANGIRNWTVLMLTYTVAILIIDNYERYGIIKQPLEIVNVVIQEIIDHWWLFVIVSLSIIQQAFQLYIIEKLLSLNIISDKLGLTLHAANAFYSVGLFVILARMYSLNWGIIRGVMQFVFFKIPKAWSYAYVNYELRQQKAKDKKDDTITIPNTYPQNVTIRNAIVYIIFTPNIQYKPSNFKRTWPNWKGYIQKLVYIFMLCCISLFIVIQFIRPELRVLKYEKWNFITYTMTLLKLMIYIHVLWLNGYLVTYKLFHPAYADLMGMSYVTFASDWWNSDHLIEFWRRWNLIIHIGMKNTVVKPLLSKDWNKNTVEMFAFFIAGVFHEILYILPIGGVFGLGIIGTLSEIPCGKLNKLLADKYGQEYGNACMWLYLHIIHTMSFIVLSQTYNLVGIY